MCVTVVSGFVGVYWSLCMGLTLCVSVGFYVYECLCVCFLCVGGCMWLRMFVWLSVCECECEAVYVYI